MGKNDICIAERIIKLDIYGAWDAELTPELLAQALNDVKVCKETITMLLDIIDELNA